MVEKKQIERTHSGPAYGCLASPSLLILSYLLFLEYTVILIEGIHMGFVLFGLVRTWKPKSESPSKKVIKLYIFGISWSREEYSSLTICSKSISL